MEGMSAHAHNCHVTGSHCFWTIDALTKADCSVRKWPVVNMVIIVIIICVLVIIYVADIHVDNEVLRAFLTTLVCR